MTNPITRADMLAKLEEESATICPSEHPGVYEVIEALRAELDTHICKITGKSILKMIDEDSDKETTIISHYCDCEKILHQEFIEDKDHA